jgi:dienelactone hydrolase
LVKLYTKIALVVGVLIANLCFADGAMPFKQSPYKSEELSNYQTIEDGFRVRVYRNNPDVGNFGTVILMHGCSGVTTHEEYYAGQLAQHGFNAVVLVSYTGRENCVNYVPAVYRLKELYLTAKWVREQDWHRGKVSVIGYSHGAAAALAASHNPVSNGIDKAIAFYPACYGYDHREPEFPTQVHIGSDDGGTPPAFCRGMYTGWFREYKFGEYYEYSGATHAFDMPLDVMTSGIVQGSRGAVVSYHIKYNPDAVELSYSRVYEFLKKD